MAQPNLGLHHAHLHKRIGSGEQYPSDDRWTRIIDRVILVGAFAGPVFTIPQLLTIWIERNAAGISLITWSAYVLGAGAWLYYGILHKEKPIIIANALWVVMDVLIVIGALLYR